MTMSMLVVGLCESEYTIIIVRSSRHWLAQSALNSDFGVSITFVRMVNDEHEHVCVPSVSALSYRLLRRVHMDVENCCRRSYTSSMPSLCLSLGRPTKYPTSDCAICSITWISFGQMAFRQLWIQFDASKLIGNFLSKRHFPLVGRHSVIRATHWLLLRPINLWPKTTIAK